MTDWRDEVSDWHEDEEWDDENGGDCFWCGGDGYVEGDDPGWDLGEWVRCSSCNGSGRAKDMTIW